MIIEQNRTENGAKHRTSSSFWIVSDTAADHMEMSGAIIISSKVLIYISIYFKQKNDCSWTISPELDITSCGNYL